MPFDLGNRVGQQLLVATRSAKMHVSYRDDGHFLTVTPIVKFTAQYAHNTALFQQQPDDGKHDARHAKRHRDKHAHLTRLPRCLIPAALEVGDVAADLFHL